jgi:hypothetical protein
MANSSSFVSQSGVSTSLIAGQRFLVTVTFTNNGTTTWTEASSYRLGPQNGQDNLNWLCPSNRVKLGPSESIAPGQTKSFTFWCEAPQFTGTYNFQWQMVQDGVAWFGVTSTNVSITVSNGTVYRIEQSADGSTGWTTIAAFTTSPGTVNGLSGANVWLRVVKTVSGVDTDYSPPYNMSLNSAPTLTATGGLGVDHISLSWTNTGGTSYNLYKYDNVLQIWKLLQNLAGTSLNDYAVSQNQFYFYYVTSVASDGTESSPSNVASARILAGGIFSMATSRASIYQGIQIGIESTPGTPVAATKRLLDIQMNQVPIIPVKSVNLQGGKGLSATQKGSQYTECKFSGPLDFNILTYLFAMCYGNLTPVLANSGYTWTWQPSSIDPVVPTSATLEEGSSKGGEKFAYATVQDIQIKWNKDDATCEGTIFGQTQTRNATMTAQIKMTCAAAASAAVSLTVATSVATGTIPNGTYVTNLGKVFVVTGGNTITANSATLTVTALAAAITAGEIAFLIPEVAPVAVDPVNVGLYISTDGTNYTQLLDGIEGQLNLNGLWAPSFHCQDTTTTFDRIVEKDPNISATITTEEGTEADNYMAYLNNGQKVWIGLKCNGPQINASPLVKYLFRINIPMFVTKPDPGDKGDVYGNTFNFELAHDQSYGIFQSTIINKLAAL